MAFVPPGHAPTPNFNNRRPKRPRHALIWPKDGKRTGTFGRLCDILTNEGPDIWVASQKGPGLGWNVPSKSQWSGWTNGNDAVSASKQRKVAPWISEGQRSQFHRYDFYSRKYKHWSPGLWSDVKWQKGAKRGDMLPIWLRTSDGLKWVLQSDGMEWVPQMMPMEGDWEQGEEGWEHGHAHWDMLW